MLVLVLTSKTNEVIVARRRQASLQRRQTGRNEWTYDD